MLLPSEADRGLRAPMSPAADHIDPRRNRLFQTVTNLSGLGPIASQYAVKCEDVDGSMLDRCVHRIKGTLRGSGDEAENQRGHRGDEPDANLYRGSRVSREVMFRQPRAQAHSE